MIRRMIPKNTKIKLNSLPTSVKDPFLLKIPYIKHNSIPVSEIKKKNLLILSLFQLKMHLVKHNLYYLNKY